MFFVAITLWIVNVGFINAQCPLCPCPRRVPMMPPMALPMPMPAPMPLPAPMPVPGPMPMPLPMPPPPPPPPPVFPMPYFVPEPPRPILLPIVNNLPCKKPSTRFPFITCRPYITQRPTTTTCKPHGYSSSSSETSSSSDSSSSSTDTDSDSYRKRRRKRRRRQRRRWRRRRKVGWRNPRRFLDAESNGEEVRPVLAYESQNGDVVLRRPVDRQDALKMMLKGDINAALNNGLNERFGAHHKPNPRPFERNNGMAGMRRNQHRHGN
ncbi:uncharacterized protein LOC142986415 [Anticarsia gemmatalis]|uniref:uncharacterized protein LOC142986415 n=1 Tax=Anticarsia gemmatalis TaxID=129554 RepID=UPI003F76274F